MRRSFRFKHNQVVQTDLKLIFGSHTRNHSNRILYFGYRESPATLREHVREHLSSRTPKVVKNEKTPVPKWHVT